MWALEEMQFLRFFYIGLSISKDWRLRLEYKTSEHLFLHLIALV